MSPKNPEVDTSMCLKEAMRFVDMAINAGYFDRKTRAAKRKAKELGKQQVYKNHFREATINGLSVINFAAKRGHVLLASLLMAHLAVDPHTTQYDQSVRTTLHYAAGGGHVQLVRELMTTYNADASARDKCGSTPLHLAIFHGHPDTAAEMIRLGASVGRQNHFGKAIHAAAFNGSLSVITAIHAKYPDQVNALICGFVTPFVCAIYGAELECENFLKQVISVDGKALLYKVVSAKTKETEAFELVRTLIELGADPNLCDEVLFEDPAIICAAKKGWEKVVSLLLRSATRIDGVEWTVTGLVNHVKSDGFKQWDTVRVNTRVSQLKLKILDELKAENCLSALIICMALKPDMNLVEWDLWKNLCQCLTCMLFEACPVKCDAEDIFPYVLTFATAQNKSPVDRAWAMMGVKACLALIPNDPRFMSLYNSLTEAAAGN